MGKKKSKANLKIRPENQTPSLKKRRIFNKLRIALGRCSRGVSVGVKTGVKIEENDEIYSPGAAILFPNCPPLASSFSL